MGGAQTVPLSDYIMLLVAIMGVAVATGIGVNVTGRSRAGCHESMSGIGSEKSVSVMVHDSMYDSTKLGSRSR